MPNLPQAGQSNVPAKPVDRLKSVLSSKSVQEQFTNALKENKNLFVASLIDLYASDTNLQKCSPSLVVMEALKAATLNLPINKSLGFAYVVPYKKKGEQIPQFQIGYKGLVQLAMRSGVYRYINAGPVYEGEFVSADKLTGNLDMTGEKVSDLVVGYFSYIETINGFRKTMFMSREDMEKYAKKYSKAYGNDQYGNTPWSTEFDSMAEKTMLRRLLSKYGQMSIEMAEGIAADEQPPEHEAEYAEFGNSQVIDIDTGEIMGDMSSSEVDQTLADETDKEAPQVPGRGF